jgi:hypothetical protein
MRRKGNLKKLAEKAVTLYNMVDWLFVSREHVIGNQIFASGLHSFDLIPCDLSTMALLDLVDKS